MKMTGEFLDQCDTQREYLFHVDITTIDAERVIHRTAENTIALHGFNDRREAWAFMREARNQYGHNRVSGYDTELRQILTPAQEFSEPLPRPVGRPALPEGEQMADRTVRMDAERWEWARQQTGGAAAYIRRLIDADREANAP